MAERTSARRYQAFGGSDSTITGETQLWRYLTFERFSWLIENQSLYHARLDQFQDPFEGSVTKAFAQARASETKPCQVAVNRFAPWGNVANLFTNYATCWHASDHESDALWKLYANGGSGIAVVSSMSRLLNSVDISPHPHGLLSHVEYIDFETHNMLRKPFATTIRPEYAKRKCFEYEREVRGLILTDGLSKVCTGGTLEVSHATLVRLQNEMPLGIKAKVDLQQLISTIVLSPLATTSEATRVHEATKPIGLSDLVRRSQLVGTPTY